MTYNNSRQGKKVPFAAQCGSMYSLVLGIKFSNIIKKKCIFQKKYKKTPYYRAGEKI
jgi:hypothetical protein